MGLRSKARAETSVQARLLFPRARAAAPAAGVVTQRGASRGCAGPVPAVAGPAPGPGPDTRDTCAAGHGSLAGLGEAISVTEGGPACHPDPRSGRREGSGRKAALPARPLRQPRLPVVSADPNPGGPDPSLQAPLLGPCRPDPGQGRCAGFKLCITFSHSG